MPSDYGPLRNVKAVHETATRPPSSYWAQCPGCGMIGTIDPEQYRGEVSVDCSRCDYHETHDHREARDD